MQHLAPVEEERPEDDGALRRRMPRKYQKALTFEERHAVIEEARERFTFTVREDGTWASMDESSPLCLTFSVA